MRVRRTDVITLDGTSKTKEGYIDTYGNLTRTGVFEYTREDGTKQLELRLPEHVFAEAAMSSFDGQPLTLRHPAQNLDAGSFKHHVVGFVLGPQKHTDGEHVRGRFRVMDKDAVAAVEGGMRELSNGYETDLVPVPGGVFRRDDWNEGKEIRADYIQTNIRGNHTAIVEKGRAGPTARLDSAGHQSENEDNMSKELQEKLDAAEKLAREKQDALDAALGREKQLGEQLKQREAAEGKARLQELSKRVSAITKRDQAELEQLGEEEIMRVALRKVSPDLDTKAWNASMLRGAFETAMHAEGKRVDTASEAAKAAIATRPSTKEDVEDHADASEKARKQMMSTVRDAWKQPTGPALGGK